MKIRSTSLVLGGLVSSWNNCTEVLKTVATAHLKLSKHWNYDHEGLSYHDCFGVKPWELTKLANAGIIRCVHSSQNSPNLYRVNDIDGVMSFLDDFEERTKEKELTDDTTVPLDPPLFDNIIGYEDLKSLVNQALTKNHPTHFCFIGPASSAKSMFLMEIERLPRSYFALGSTASKSGLVDLLFEQEPKYLIIDEVDKANSRDLAVLLSLMQTGIVSETKYKRRGKKELDTFVFLAANRGKYLSPELLSRAFVFHFKEYDDDTFKKTVMGVLTEQFDINGSIAIVVAEHCINELKTHDVREAIRIARLVETPREVSDVVEVLKRYRGG